MGTIIMRCTWEGSSGNHDKEKVTKWRIEREVVGQSFDYPNNIIPPQDCCASETIWST